MTTNSYTRAFLLRQGLARVLMALLLGFSAASMGAEVTGQAAFDKGRSAFAAHDYESALDFFNEARRQGYSEPPLSFSIGSTLYRLERYDEARSAFLSASKHPPLTQISYLNLGLISAKQDDVVQARNWFERTEALAPDSDVAKLARTMLKRIDQRSNARAAPRPLIMGLVSADVGYEDKAVSAEENTPASDETNTFAELFGYAKAGLTGDFRHGIYVNGSLYVLENESVSAADIFMGGVGLGKAAVFGKREASLEAAYSRTDLDGDGYQGQADLLAKLKIPVSSYYHSYRYQYSNLSALDERYSYVEGDRHRVRVEVGTRSFSPLLKAHYEYEYNDRADLRTATTFKSYSPVRHSVRVIGRVNLTDNWQTEGKFDYRTSKYRDDNVSPVESFRREEERLRAAVELARNVMKNGKVSLAYEYTRNDSNLAGLDYDRNQFKTGVEWIF